MSYDVVTFGETMLRLSPPNNLRIEQAITYEAHVGGSESNTAVGLAHLGANVCWFSRLPNNVLGHMIANRIREHGVDISHVIWTDDERLGLYFVEHGIQPRTTQVLYDRANSAMSNIRPSELPDHIFHAETVRLLHITGITLALSSSAQETVIKAIQHAKQVNTLVSFDVNFRSKLWTNQQARIACEPCMEQADIIFVPLRDARQLFDYPLRMTQKDVLRKLHNLFPQAIVVMTLGEDGSICCDANGVVFVQEAFPTTGDNRIGTGDAFNAGFLYCYLHNECDLQQSLQWGNAMASLKRTISGDMPIISKSMVIELIHQNHLNLIQR